MINDKIDSFLDNAKEGTSLGSWKAYNKQALLTLIEEIVDDIIGEDLKADTSFGSAKMKRNAAKNQLKREQRANFKKVMGE